MLLHGLIKNREDECVSVVKVLKDNRCIPARREFDVVGMLRDEGVNI